MEFSAEKLAAFQKENGMSLDEAWEKVKEWHLAGKEDAVERGCEIILEFFPEHEAKNFLKNASGAEPETHSFAEKAGGTFADEVEHLLTKKSDSDETTEPKESNENTAENIDPKPQSPVLEEERLYGTIAYAWIFCLVPLLLKKNSAFVQFHAKQGLVMAIIITLFDFTVGAFLNTVFGGFNFILKLLYILALGFAAYKAYQGQQWKIPGIYKLSEKIKL